MWNIGKVENVDSFKFLQGVEEESPYGNQRTNSEETSLVLNQFASVQKVLPLLSVIPEVQIKLYTSLD